MCILNLAVWEVMATFTPPPIDDRPLKERVETIWKRNLHNLPVYKDFPRLAGGFEIINGNNKQIVRSLLLK